jgi:hypothetical protein
MSIFSTIPNGNENRQSQERGSHFRGETSGCPLISPA